MEKENPNFKFYVTITRLKEDEVWAGRRGRVTPEWVKENVSDLDNTVFYACGPNELVEFAEEVVLHGLGVGKDQMKTEKWG
jgi:NAD(P)H-flavin reductase